MQAISASTQHCGLVLAQPVVATSNWCMHSLPCAPGSCLGHTVPSKSRTATTRSACLGAGENNNASSSCRPYPTPSEQNRSSLRQSQAVARALYMVPHRTQATSQDAESFDPRVALQEWSSKAAWQTAATQSACGSWARSLELGEH